MTPKQKVILDAALEVAAVLQDFAHEERDQIITISGQLILSEDHERENAPLPPSKVISINRDRGRA